ncbi:DM13 domain-containing protein [Alkalihalobacterium sp. APHAB7]|uniref:DM13 domain-containing protein n=1 Tax=Alkalihalobacterium sp. APHAB7 TaxID=3402081 RepID=UPI003AADB334
MKKITLLFFSAVSLTFLCVVVWWLISPMFLDQVVDEALPKEEHASELVLDGAGPKLDTDKDKDEKNQELLEYEPVLQFIGSFVDGERNYKASGIAKTIEASGTRYLRFEDFNVTNGPDLFVYLVKSGKDTTDGINLGKLGGNIGNQNYELPIDIDLIEYSSVVIYCRAFSRIFGTADLSLSQD